MQINIHRSESRVKNEISQRGRKKDEKGNTSTSNESSDFNERSSSEEGGATDNPHQIQTVDELLVILGVKMNDEGIFKIKGKAYKLNNQIRQPMLTPYQTNNSSMTQSVRVEWTVQNNLPSLPHLNSLDSNTTNNSGGNEQNNFFGARHNRSMSRSKNRTPGQQPSNVNLPTINVQIVGPHLNAPAFEQIAQRMVQKSPRSSLHDQFQKTMQPKPTFSGISEILNRDVQLAYLFASPLVLETSEGNYFDCLPPIGFKEEFEQILQTLETENLAFKYRYMMANDANLRECLNDNPIGLHFAGHGFENKETLFKNDKKAWIKNKNKGDILIFEQSNGASSFYCEKDLQELLEETYKHQTLDFVVVASCHSECVGKIFQKAGAKHVICIDQKKLLQDDAAINFSRTFYSNIYGSNFSICDSFYNAKNSVKKQISAAEGEKFKLFLSDDHPKVCKKNDIRRRIPQGDLEYKGITPKVLKLPTKVTPFISRNGDMFDVIKRLQETNILQVFGMPGMGKSSLLKNVSNYIGERNVYRDGVLYINFNQAKTFKDVLETIIQNLEDNINPNFTMGMGGGANGLGGAAELMALWKQDKSKLVRHCIKKFQKFKKSLLFVLDDIDDVGKDFPKELASFMTQLVQESANAIKILFCSSIYFESLENYKVKKLRGLDKANSVELFLAKIPLENEELEEFLNYDKAIMELHDYTQSKMSKDILKIQMCKHRSGGHNQKCVRDYLEQHPLFELLAGQPLSLSLIAPLSLKHSLKEIYQKILDSPLTEIFNGRVKEDALILSLEFSLKVLNETDSKAVELFYIIGLTSQGLFEEDLEQLFEEEDTMTKLQSLIEICLIQQEYLDKAGKLRRFKVSPFIDKYVEQKLTDTSKRELNMFLATYYVNKLMKLKKQYAENQDQGILILAMQMYENNIRKCIQRLFKVDYYDKIAEDPAKLKLNIKQNSVSGQKLCVKDMIDFGNASLKLGKNSLDLSNRKITISPQKKIRISSNRTSLQNSPNVNHLMNNSSLTGQNADNPNRIVSDFESIASTAQYRNIDQEKQKADINFLINNLHTHNFPAPVDQDDAKPKVMSNQIEMGTASQQSGVSRFQTVKAKRPFIIRPANSLLIDEQMANSRRTSLSTIKNSGEEEDFMAQAQAQFINQQVDPNSEDFGSRLKSQIYASTYDDLEIGEIEKIQYNLQLEKLQKLNKQIITQNRFDQLVRSLTYRMGGSHTDELDKLLMSKLNFTQPLNEQLAQLLIYEKLLFHYATILALIEGRGAEIANLICPDEEQAKNVYELRVPHVNKLIQANLRMVYIFYLLKNQNYDTANSENLEMKSLFQDLNCDVGQAISLYISAKSLQKMRRRGAYSKAEKYVIKSAELFEASLETEGMQQCIKLLKKINPQSPQIATLSQRLLSVGMANVQEIRKRLEDRVYLDKVVMISARNGIGRHEDLVRNLLLNVIEFSYLNKGSPQQSAHGKGNDGMLQAINQTPNIVSKKINMLEYQPANNLFLKQINTEKQ